MQRLILSLLIFTLGLALPPMKLSAQSEGGFPVSEGFIYDWDAEVIFPMGMYFTVKVYRPLVEIQNVTLTLQHGTSAPIQITLDPEEGIALNDLETEYSYTWAFDTPLPLLTEVTYHWQAQAAGGQFASLRDRLLFEDQRTEWRTSEVFPPRVRITTSVDGPTPEQVWAQIAPAYALLTENTGRPLSLDLMLYTNGLSAEGCTQGTRPDGESGWVVVSPNHEITLPCASANPRRAHQIYYDAGFTLVETTANSAMGAEEAIVNRLVADFYADIWTSANTPAWFQSGMAQFYVSGSKGVSLEPVRSDARTNRLRALTALEDTAFTDAAGRMQSYAQVLYIADTIGVDGLFDLARQSSNVNFAAAYESAMGQPLNRLQTHLSRWIFTESAASAYGYDPYLPQTPTPTATLTATASTTTTPSETASPTITPSVTGVHSPTPSRTPSPTATAIPATATVTPRPAGSLFTPTPIPTSILDDPIGQQGVLAVVFIVLSIIGVASIIIWRRND